VQSLPHTPGCASICRVVTTNARDNDPHLAPLAPNRTIHLVPTLLFSEPPVPRIYIDSYSAQRSLTFHSPHRAVVLSPNLPAFLPNSPPPMPAIAAVPFRVYLFFAPHPVFPSATPLPPYYLTHPSRLAYPFRALFPRTVADPPSLGFITRCVMRLSSRTSALPLVGPHSTTGSPLPCSPICTTFPRLLPRLSPPLSPSCLRHLDHSTPTIPHSEYRPCSQQSQRLMPHAFRMQPFLRGSLFLVLLPDLRAATGPFRH